MQQIIHVSPANARSKGPPPPGNLAVPILSNNGIDLEFYAPLNRDPQQPHTRDELYFVATGSGVFFDGEQRRQVQQGDMVFVPAGRAHRFEEFSIDFTVWVVFFGPEQKTDDERAE